MTKRLKRTVFCRTT